MSSSSLARWLGPVLLPALVGCVGSRGDTDLLEARLRDQQDLVGRYEKLLDSNQQELTLARQEADLLRTQIVAANASPILPEHADVLLRADKLAFHEMMTGTRDVDGRPGDEALNVVLMPQSNDGDTIRLFGELEIEALDLSRPEGEQRVGNWKFSAQQARELWHSGFLASGYQLDIPWRPELRGPDLVLHARLVTADGRQFDASHQVRVDLPVQQTAATGPDVPPLIEPRRMAATEPAQPINVSEPSLAPISEPAPLEPIERPRAADVAEATAPNEDATSAPDLSVAATPFDTPDSAPTAAEPVTVATDAASAIEPPPFPGAVATAPGTSSPDFAPLPDAIAAEPGTAAAEVAPFPAPSVAVAKDSSQQADPVEQPQPQLVARPTPATPFDIIPRHEPGWPEATAPLRAEAYQADPFPQIQPREDRAAPAAATPFAPHPNTATMTDVPPPSDPFKSSPEPAVSPFDLPQVSPPPAVPGVTIQPLAPPQRYRRTEPAVPVTPASESPVAPQAIPQAALRPAVEPEPPASGEQATEFPTNPQPFPVDVTQPPAQGVIQSSVNWTDESIPYLR